MINFHSFLVFLLIFAGVSVGCSSTKSFQVAEAGEYQIDGNLSDWNTGSTLVESTNESNYYAAYDDNFLYLFIDVRSPFRDNAIRQSGLIVYLNNSEDQRESVGIAYPAGTFNLLRENPGMYDSFINDPEWSQNPDHTELLTNLSEELLARAMIVEQAAGRSDRQHGFIDPSQLEIDGMEIAASGESRYLSIEMKIPLDGSSIYGIETGNIWLGFDIDPPDFRIPEDNSDMTSQNRGMYGSRARNNSQNQRANMRRNLGQYSQWFLLELDD